MLSFLLRCIQAIYLFITYIVTSKPKRISVAAGVVHMIDLLLLINFTTNIQLIDLMAVCLCD